jgi:hypothetical protein
MGAGASSEYALRNAVLSSVGAHTTAYNPPCGFSDPKTWRMAHVGQWLKHLEMGTLIPTFESHGIDGQILLEDMEETDFDELVPFKPLRRKLKRCVQELKDQAASGSYDAHINFKAYELQSSLEQLNQSMEALIRTVPWTEQQQAEISRTLASALQHKPSQVTRIGAVLKWRLPLAI